MSGFDPSRFMSGDPSPRVAEDGGGWAAPEFEPKAAENRDVWQDEGQSVAGAATVAAPPCELTLDKPFAADLNRLFCQPESARYAGEAWRRLLLAIHRFADTHAQACLDAGWSDRELFAVPKRAFLSEDEPQTHRSAVRGFSSPAVCFAVGKREVLEITPEWIRIVMDRFGHSGRIMKEHNRINTNPLAFALVWEVPLF